jgi:hypothetical protein
MSNVITLRVPESLYARVKKLAKDDGISLNQYVQLALAEKLAREETLQMMEGQINKLDESLKVMYLERELEFQEKFNKELRRVTNRYQMIEREARAFRNIPPP